MAKAIDKRTPGTWLPLDEAIERTVRLAGNPDAAKIRIIQILDAGQWRGESLDGTRKYAGTLPANCSAWARATWARAKIEPAACSATWIIWGGAHGTRIVGYETIVRIEVWSLDDAKPVEPAAPWPIDYACMTLRVMYPPDGAVPPHIESGAIVGDVLAKAKDLGLLHFSLRTAHRAVAKLRKEPPG